ncbi:MAG: NAD(P)H-dependent oxidoreductase [Deltaproteobacteria bacterium]|nr:NAD(P)H-dependent oxidoreductase [Deltaproteobacteria bacterium]
MSIRVLGIVGSLRAASYNGWLLRAAVDMAPAGMEIEIFSKLGDLPLFDQDLEARGDPETVRSFKAAIQSADALLFASPEYNFGMTGALKNAIDWASRPPGKSVLSGKPAAIMGASPGSLGTARAQLQLRQSLLATQTYAMLQPEVLVAKAHEKFDAQGRLTDEPTRKLLQRFLQAFAEWVARLRVV